MLKSLIFSALLVLCGTGQAYSKTMQAVWSGQLYSSADIYGLFGAPNSTLDGQTFIMTMRFDTSRGTRLTTPGVADELSGGVGLAQRSPMLSASLQIGTHVEVLSPKKLGSASVYESTSPYLPEGYFTGAEEFTALSNGGNRDFSMSAYTYGLADGQVPNDLDTPFSLAGLRAQQQGGRFQFRTYDPSVGGLTTDVWGYFIIDSLTVSSTSVAAVPLPASGLLLLCATGLLLRRRQRIASA